MYLLLIILMFAFGIEANQFMHVPKVRRISLSKIKEQAADAFSEQLRLAAETVQLAGAVQVAYHMQAHKVDLGAEIEQLKEIGARIYQCRVQYADLLVPANAVPADAVPADAVSASAVNPFRQKDVSVMSLFGHLMQTLGALQQYMITYLQDIFEDKGCVFIKQHTNRLPEAVKTVILYTDDFKALKETLCSIEKKMRDALGLDVQCRDARPAASAQKA